MLGLVRSRQILEATTWALNACENVDVNEACPIPADLAYGFAARLVGSGGVLDASWGFDTYRAIASLSAKTGTMFGAIWAW